MPSAQARSGQPWWIVALLVAIGSLATWLMLSALIGNQGLFLIPSQLDAHRLATHSRLMVGGKVVTGTLEYAAEGVGGSFILVDPSAPDDFEAPFCGDFPPHVVVQFQGLLPDLFAEGEVATVRGVLTDATVGNWHISATEVFAKHDENYQPPLPQSAAADAR